MDDSSLVDYMIKLIQKRIKMLNDSGIYIK